MAAAAIIFFAFYGFDAIATAAEEAKNPDRDLAIGIVGSMILCVIIYMAVAAVAIGALAYTRFADSAEPLALILREINQGWAAKVLDWDELIASPGFQCLEMLTPSDAPRQAVVVAAPLRFDGRRPRSQPAPRLNDHGERLRREGWG